VKRIKRNPERPQGERDDDEDKDIDAILRGFGAPRGARALRREFAFTFNVVKRAGFWHTAALPHMNAAQQQPVTSPTEPRGSDPAKPPAEAAKNADEQSRPREIGGRGGLDPTRYGDWERAGRCIDF
jgi:hypothetical protein